MHLSCAFGSEIVIGEGLDLGALILKHLPKNIYKIAVITDAHVLKLHGDSVSSSLTKSSIDHVLLPFSAGEKFKTRKTKEQLEDLLLSHEFGRDSLIIALGGGVVSDVAGFIAATYARGVSFMSIPTTLMAMVDAAIGGKVGVNTPLAKNIIGAFYPASLILIDTEFLKTESNEGIKNGLAEVYKYAFIRSPHLLDLLTNNSSMYDIICASCIIKKEIVEEDPKEKGKRAILNFGHTIGHALETASHYTLPHGFAVAHGMRIESFISHSLGYLSQKDLECIEHHLQDFPIPAITHPEKIYQALTLDKKNKGSKPRFVLLEKIGSPLSCGGSYCQEVPREIIEKAILYSPRWKKS